MRRLYISGPVSLGGLLNDAAIEANSRVFHDAATALRGAGYHVTNPIELVEHIDLAEPWETFMRVDLAAMLECYGVALLPDWRQSRGARLERFLAHELDLDVRTVDHWLMLAQPEVAAA